MLQVQVAPVSTVLFHSALHFIVSVSRIEGGKVVHNAAAGTGNLSLVIITPSCREINLPDLILYKSTAIRGGIRNNYPRAIQGRPVTTWLWAFGVWRACLR
eukprot:scpid52471/ scgid10820/ 